MPARRCLTGYALVLVVAVLCLTGCQPSFQFNDSQMTPDQMLDRATLVFAGVIEKQTFVNWPFLRVPAKMQAGGAS